MDIINSNLKALFNNKCKVVDLNHEYDHFTGKERYAIITDLTEDEVTQVFDEYVEVLKPFIILSPEIGEVIRLYWANEKKYEKRDERGEIPFLNEETKDELIKGLYVPDDQIRKQLAFEERKSRDRKAAMVKAALKTLTPTQRRRLIDYHIMGMTLAQIASDEGVAPKNIQKSIKLAEKKFIDACERQEVA